MEDVLMVCRRVCTGGLIADANKDVRHCFTLETPKQAPPPHSLTLSLSLTSLINFPGLIRSFPHPLSIYSPIPTPSPISPHPSIHPALFFLSVAPTHPSLLLIILNHSSKRRGPVEGKAATVIPTRGAGHVSVL